MRPGAHTTPPYLPTAHTDLPIASPPPTAPATQEPPSDEEQGAMDSDANFELSFHQEGDYTFLDATVYAAIVELLLELEKVDPEPDFWARSIRGPWHIAVNEDCAQQFKERYGDITTLRINQTDISVRVKVDSIDEKINKKGSTSRKALYNALQDVAAVSYTHLTLPTICSV